MTANNSFAEALQNAVKQHADVEDLRNKIEGFRQTNPNLPICEATHIGVLPDHAGYVALKAAETLDGESGFYQQFDLSLCGLEQRAPWSQQTKPASDYKTVYRLDKSTPSGRPAVSGKPSPIWPPQSDSGVPVTPAAVSRFNTAVSHVDHPYHSLAQALLGAFEQASEGKGKERHANDLPFTEQKMQRIPQVQGHVGGLIYQIAKKAMESERMEPNARIRELQGVIVYAAGAIVFTDSDHGC